MANFITAGFAPDLPVLRMSNGLTAVVLDVLVLSGSALACTDWEQDTVVWLASHDQSCLGIGLVGFDVAELPWTTDGLAAQQRFVLAMIAGAEARTGWDRLGYAPREDWAFDCLAQLRVMVARLSVPLLQAGNGHAQVLRRDRARCPLHDVYLHNLCESGCIICNYR
jgi:hypothetical protein